MGITSDNVELHVKSNDVTIKSHRSPGDVENEYRFTVGTASSPWFSQADHDALKAEAAGGFLSFADKVEAIVPLFWAWLSYPGEQAFFKWYADTAPAKLRFRLHRGDQQIDRVSPLSSFAEAKSLFDAAVVSFAAFDGVAASVWGSSWTGAPSMDTARRQAFRSAAIDF